MADKFKLAEGTQVRNEDFGLLFYTRRGPRLYFLPSGKMLTPGFFTGGATLTQWVENGGDSICGDISWIRSLKNALCDLRDKGVIIEF
jgi:putative mycofactocin binding protein MftB